MTNFKKTRDKAVSGMLDEVTEALGPNIGSSELGDAIVSTTNGRWDLYKRQITDPIYNSVAKQADPAIVKVPIYKDGRVVDVVDQEVGGAKFSLKKLKESVQPQLGKIEYLNDISSDQMGDNLIMAISKLPDEVNYSTIKELRTRLLAYVDNASIVNPKSPAIGNAKKLIGEVHNTTQQGLRDFDVSNGTKTLQEWEYANSLYKEGKDQFNNKFLRKLTALADPKGQHEPAKVMGRIFQRGGIDNVDKVVNAVGPEIHGQMKRWYVEDVLKSATDRDGVVKANVFYDKLFGKQAIDPKFSEKFFSNSEFQTLKNVSDTLDVVNMKLDSTLGAVAIQMAQLGALTGLAYGGYSGSNEMTGTGVAILVSPAIAAKMLTSPIATRWLTNKTMLPGYTAPIVSDTMRLAKVVEIFEKQVKDEDRKADLARDKQ